MELLKELRLLQTSRDLQY